VRLDRPLGDEAPARNRVVPHSFGHEVASWLVAHRRGRRRLRGQRSIVGKTNTAPLT
jgi:hypothetical protein